MRIRKNSRVLVEEKKTSFLVCKLNRSPWDDESLFSQLVQEGWDNCLPLNGSLDHSNLVSDSNPSGDSMELSFEYIEKRELGKEGREINGLVEAKTTSLCNEYLSKQVVDHQAQPPQPPLVVVSPPLKKRGRPKKPPQVAAAGGGGRSGINNSNNNTNSNNNNSYSFYYYSGFGPSWSKKRGIVGNIYNNSKNYNKYNTKRRKKHHNDNYNRKADGGDDDGDDENEDGIINIKKSKIDVKKTETNEEIDYIDDDFDDDEEDDNNEDGSVRARPRKPVKARSLKSLM